MSNTLPRILLIGAGRFGRNHLRVLLKLHSEGLLKLCGVVVKSEKGRRKLLREVTVPVHTNVTVDLLRDIDAVDIVTPAHTHDALIRTCLPRAHVFVEKPFSSSCVEAKAHNALARRKERILMVGHIFRFHPLSRTLHKIFLHHYPIRITGSFTSSISTDRGESAVYEEMHFFDLMDFWFKEKPLVVWSRESERVTDVSLRYARFDAQFAIGWKGYAKVRLLHFQFGPKAPWKHITADFTKSTITFTTATGEVNTEQVSGIEPLEAELTAFIRSIQLGVKPDGFPDGTVGLRVQETLERALPPLRRKPRIAIIGGGIFGTTTALVLGTLYDVTVFERHQGILEEASYANQYRHHSGFHYPRSPKTIAQIRESRDDFESFYRSAIVRVKSYIAVARRNSKVSAKTFMRVCKKNGLALTKEFPPAGFLDRRSVSESFVTNEAVYDYVKLKKVITQRVSRNHHITLRLRAEVVGISLMSNGEKEVAWRLDGVLKRERFDYCINATYARYNTFCQWLKFPLRNIEYRFKEILVIALSVKERPAVMVVDGPFATLVPIPRTSFYTLGDVPLSVHATAHDFSEALLRKWKRTTVSRAKQMLLRCTQWFPVLAQARLIESRFVVLPIDVGSVQNDDRITSLMEHGFGCFSILEGKIITAVSFAKELTNRIKALEKRQKRGRV